jgi:hypothetical protein
MDKQREAFEKELLTVWRTLDLDCLLERNESGEYIDKGTKTAWYFWQLALEHKTPQTLTELFLEEAFDKVESLQAEIEQLKNPLKAIVDDYFDWSDGFEIESDEDSRIHDLMINCRDALTA